MKSIKYFVTFFSFFCFLYGMASAQEISKNDKNNKIEVIEEINLNDYKEWDKKDFKDFTIYLPQDFNEVKVKPIDSKVWEFKSDNFLLSFDLGQYGGGPSWEKRQPQYFQKYLIIDEMLSKFWSYKDDEKVFKYGTSILFYLRDENLLKLKISFFYNNVEDCNLGEKIFKSVKFDSKYRSRDY